MGWHQEPDAPGVLIQGTPPSSLHGGLASRTAQALNVAGTSKEDFPQAVREALQRQMTSALAVAELGSQERALWERVQDLWRAAANRDTAAIRAALHPRYAGWIGDEPAPHGRDAAVTRSIEGGTVLHYQLVPKSIVVYDGQVGVVHYAYAAAIADEAGTRHVDGRWTEVYGAKGDAWLLLSVTGGPRAE